ncbi:ATP/GTP-binding protein [Streptomyces microflavus]|uniref:ATP/GTP-binding protein n=1 Tax=Streptomyces microflavus TaxID=1919 RepID=UPI00342C95A8
MSHDDAEPPAAPPTTGQLINFPTGNGVLDRPPELPDPSRLFPAPQRADIPAESPEETTMELPAVPQSPDPVAALRSEGIDPPDSEESDIEEYGEEYGEEYEQRRSLADRLGDWLEFRLERARARHESEGPFREAEIARKVALLGARSAQDSALIEQNGKLRQAMLKAQADKAGARGKADAAGMKSGGGGSPGDKGRKQQGPAPRTPPNRTNPQQPKPKPQAPSPKPQQPKPPTPNKQQPQQPQQPQRPKQPAPQQPKPAPKPLAPKQPKQKTPDKPPPRKPDKQQDRGKSPGPGPKGPGPKGPGPAPKNGPDSKNGPGPKKGPGPKGDQGGKEKPGSKGGLGAGDKKGWGSWKKRPKDVPTNGPAKDTTGKDHPGKGGAGKHQGSPKKGPGGGPGSPGSTGSPKGRDGSEKGRRKSSKGSSGSWWKPGAQQENPRDDTSTGPGSGARPGSGRDPFGEHDPEYTAEWPGHSPADQPQGRENSQHQSAGGDGPVVDAVIVDDPSDPFGADRIRQPGLTTGTPGLPPAPERHAQRPDTSRPTAQEDPVASEVNKPASGQARMAAKHRTDITFGDYLMEIVNIAIAAGLDKDRAQELAVALGKVADALRDMASDLVGDHNIATEVVDQITDLADAASRMKALAERCAAECEIASEAARLAAMSVGRVYGQDMQAMDEAGLANASSAAHHD